MKQMGEQRVAVISLEAAIDPAATDGLDPVRLGADQSPARQAYLRLVMERLINWCIIACPTPEWAARVHPDLPVGQAFELLSQEIARVCRLDEDDPVAAWQTRFDRLTEISERLGEHRFEAIHFSGDGTDLTVGLLPSAEWSCPAATRIPPPATIAAARSSTRLRKSMSKAWWTSSSSRISGRLSSIAAKPRRARIPCE